MRCGGCVLYINTCIYFDLMRQSNQSSFHFHFTYWFVCQVRDSSQDLLQKFMIVSSPQVRYKKMWWKSQLLKYNCYCCWCYFEMWIRLILQYCRCYIEVIKKGDVSLLYMYMILKKKKNISFLWLLGCWAEDCLPLLNGFFINILSSAKKKVKYSV